MRIKTIRHSLSHILAAAVQELYPGAKFGIGPAIENGFYYDLSAEALAKADLPRIEKRMKELIKQNISFKKRTVSKIEAKKLFSAQGGSASGGKGQPYKLELLGLAEQPVSIYESGKFVDLCKGPHVKSTLQLHSGQAKEIIDGFKLTKVAGAYWRSDEKIGRAHV